MKTVDELKPNFGPVYAAALYPGLAPIFHRHGYALAVHGSLARDFDIIAVPWGEVVSRPEDVLAEVTKEFAVTLCGEPQQKNHGRVAYTFSVGFGSCSCDLSFLPSVGNTARRVDIARTLLILLWQAFDAQGHSCGRSAASGLLEAAMDLLGPPRDAVRSGCESKVAELLREAKDIATADSGSEMDHVWKNPGTGPADAEVWREKLRREIESGFEGRMA